MVQQVNQNAGFATRSATLNTRVMVAMNTSLLKLQASIWKKGFLSLTCLHALSAIHLDWRANDVQAEVLFVLCADQSFLTHLSE